MQHGCDEPIEQVVQELRAVKMPQRVSRQLGLHPDALALQLLRRYMTKDGVLIASLNWHPADQFAYTMKIDRSSAP
jgi:GntR family transcriptional regulator